MPLDQLVFIGNSEFAWRVVSNLAQLMRESTQLGDTHLVPTELKPGTTIAVFEKGFAISHRR